MTKATHSGTCQVCGSLQKLPHGKLSKHGYTKKWGFFSGTCPGAEYLPFELSKDRIELAIVNVKNQVVALEEEITTLSTSSIEDVAPFRAYGDRGIVTGYFETTCRVYLNASGVIMLAINHGSTKEDRIEPAFRYSLHGDVPQIVFQLRSQKISRIKETIRQRNTYIQWQESRISNWAPHTENLKEVVK